MDLELAWLRSWPDVTVVRDIALADEAALEWAAAPIDREGNRIPMYGVNLVKVRDGTFTHVRASFDPTRSPQRPSR